MTSTKEDQQLQEIKTLLHSTPKWVQLIVLRFLKLSMADSGFWAYHQAVTAERGFMPPRELGSFMDRWIEEHPSKERADV